MRASAQLQIETNGPNLPLCPSPASQSRVTAAERRQCSGARDAALDIL